MITGAFHEDGLADMADGFGAGGSPKKINKIIHDSRLGTYGTTALILGLLIRLGLVINLVELGYSLLLILSSSIASGKLSIIFTRNYFTVSTFSKTGSIIKTVSNKMLLIVSLIWLIPVVYFFPFWGVLIGFFLNSGVIFFIGKMSQKKNRWYYWRHTWSNCLYNWISFFAWDNNLFKACILMNTCRLYLIRHAPVKKRWLCPRK